LLIAAAAAAAAVAVVAAAAAPAAAAPAAPAAAPAAAAPAIVTPVGLVAPDRLTAGPANQFLGVVAAASGGPARELYFASDEESTTQIYVQDLISGIPRLAFDELADVTWPRPSPDGRHLLYISYREDAAGDLCVREILGEPGARRFGARHCLTGSGSAELQAVWYPDSRTIAVVTRPGLHGDFELHRLSISGGGGGGDGASSSARLVPGSISSPAISPDGNWLVTVPVERTSRVVGPSFLGRSTGALELTSLQERPRGRGDKPAEPARLAFALPGASAMPAFSPDGKWLYFTQFLNDTNFDGSIDGNDHGVLFRAAFDGGTLAAPEQLSSAAWSCQYPIPAADRLITTCVQQGSLDVFALPPGGAIPDAWRAQPALLTERIDDELTSSSDRWERLLLLAHRGATAEVLREMIRLHLELGELQSALFYAERLERGDGDAAAGAALRELAEQRRAERALERGSLSAPFVTAARARLKRLAAIAHPLAALAASEIYDTLGEEAAARAALEPVAPKVSTLRPEREDVKAVAPDPLVTSLYADRLLSLYRDDPRYFELQRPVAEENLAQAEVFVRELLRGATAPERARRVERWLGRVDAYSDLAFLLELERSLADLTPASQEQVRERVFQLYRKNKDLARRKALVGATVRRALTVDNEYLLYNFAESWVSYVPREKAERRRAERLYRDAVFERAYVEEARGNRGDARAHFYGVTLQTESLEAHAGFLEMRIAEGNDPAKDYPGSFSPVAIGYARAYLEARRLPQLFNDAAAHQRADAAAIRELTAIARVAPQRAEVHQLWGFVAYQRFLRTGDRLAAVEANAHALIALDLSRGDGGTARGDSPRARAAVLDLVGRIQAAVGNFGLALGWLEQRSKLPFASPRAQLSHCLAMARARYHTGDAVTAAADAERCVAMTANPDGEAARYRPLALDRAGLYHLAAGQPAAAAARYAELWPLVERGAGASTRGQGGTGGTGGTGGKSATVVDEAARNKLTTRLGQASAALAMGAPALAFVAEAERLLALGAPPARPGPYGREQPIQALPADSYQLLLLGLRAQAHAQAGAFAAAGRVLGERRDAVARRLAAGDLDEDLYELALCEAQLASFAQRGGSPRATVVEHLAAAHEHWLAWSTRTGTPVEDTGLAILTSAAELHLSSGVPMSQLGFDLAAELTASYTQLNLVRNPAWEAARSRIATYLTTMNLRSTR
jgi:cellulose synthase operon protein C